MKIHSNVQLLVGTLGALCLLSGCDSKESEGPKASEVRQELRDKAGLHPEDRVDPMPQSAKEAREAADLHPTKEKRPDSAEALKDEVGLVGDGEKAKNAEELKKKMDIHEP